MNKIIPLDYSKKEYWLRNEADKKDADYDLIFFCGTSMFEPSLENGVGTNFDQFRFLGTANSKVVADPLNDNARLFIPIQRQIALKYALNFNDHEALLKQIYEKEPFSDLCAALDYYFENYNKDAKRPFVIAGHSQGAASCQVLLEHYFLKTNKREYLKNMVCMYSLGYGIRKSWFENLPNKEGLIHFAFGAGDYNSVVSWNVEGPGEKGRNFLLADPGEETLLINPLNWKLDETYAPKELNKGVLIDDGKPIEQREYYFTNEPQYLFDAQIDLKRGSLITNGSTNYMAFPNCGNLWGGKSLHSYDGRGYFANLKENVRLRVNNFIKEKRG